MVVLGSIVAGIATPTEAAAIGAAGTMVLAAFAGEMSFANLRDSVLETCRTTGMILFVAIGATCYSVIFKRRSEEHTSELQSLMRISYAVFCLKKKKPNPSTSNVTL